AVGLADGHAGLDVVAAAGDDGSVDRDPGAEAAAGSDPGAGADDAERSDVRILRDGRGRVDQRGAVDRHSRSSSDSGAGAEGGGGARRGSRRRPMWPWSAARRNSRIVLISGYGPNIFSTSASASGLGSPERQIRR